MPVAPFVPLIVSGIGAVGGALRKPKDAGAAQSGAATALALQQGGQARSLFEQATPLTAGATNYFGRLLNGNRAALRASVAPEAAEITDVYRGAEKSLSRSNIVGPSRDVATAELARDRAGRVASLVPMARRAAAGQAAELGTTLTGQAMTGTQGAGSLLGNLAGGQRQQQAYQDEQSYTFGKNLGGLITDVYKAWPRKGADGGGNMGFVGA